MKSIRIAGEDIHIAMTLTIFATGLAGGMAARALGFPLPMLLGSVMAVGALSVFGFRPGGQPPKVPVWLRMLFMPIIGLSIGAAFTPAILQEARQWWPSLLALLIYIPLAHFTGYQVFRRLGRLSPVTAYYAAIPGGFVESIAMGEEKGADVGVLTTLQFLRLILSMMLVPMAFTILSGGAVGSAAGLVIGQAEVPFTPAEAALQAGLGAIGFFAGRRLHLPAFMVTGPILMSAMGHLAGLIEATPPRILIDITQIVVGVALGTRFVGMVPRRFLSAAWLAMVAIVLTLAIALAAAVLLHGIVGERIEAVVLAFAPGGLAEMSLVALSLNISVLYVTTHHVTRILLAVTVARIFAGRIAPEN